MSLPVLKASFDAAAASGRTSISLAYKSDDRALRSLALLNRLIDIEQRGVDPLRDPVLNEEKNSCYVFVPFDRQSEGKARALFDSWREELDGEQYHKDPFRFIPGKGFHIEFTPGHHTIAEFAEEAAQRGLRAYLHKGFKDFDPERPLSFDRKTKTVSLHFNPEKSYDGEAQGATWRRFLHALEDQNLLPEKLTLSGMESYLTKRLTLTFNDFAGGMEVLRDLFLPLGYNLNADFFVEKINPGKSQVTLLAHEGVKTQLQENMFSEGPVQVKITQRSVRPCK